MNARPTYHRPMQATSKHATLWAVLAIIAGYALTWPLVASENMPPEADTFFGLPSWVPVAAMGGLLFAVTVIATYYGRWKAVWLAPQILLMAVTLITLPESIASCNGTICFQSYF